jgi:hypothetical protein
MQKAATNISDRVPLHASATSRLTFATTSKR